MFNKPHLFMKNRIWWCYYFKTVATGETAKEAFNRAVTKHWCLSLNKYFEVNAKLIQC